MGYITKTNGISIHRKNCSNVTFENERLIEASFNNVTKNKYYSEIILYSNSKDSIFIDIVQVAANLNIQVENMNIINKSDNYVYSIILLVNNITELNKCINSLKKIKHITEVERVI